MTIALPRFAVVVAARPNFMKVGPVISALGGRAVVDLIHTGQHYDEKMSASFFDDLGLPRPDTDLGIGSGSHAQQTGAVMARLEPYLIETSPAVVIVVGDVNSTMAAAITSAKAQIPVAHVEAGLRSFDWSMPEEINRVITDRLSTWLFTPSADGDENLIREGMAESAIHRVGNVMIDTLERLLPKARAGFDAVRSRLSLPKEYAVLTLHRPGNVDDPAALAGLMGAVNRVADRIPLVFPVHPRTAPQLREHGLDTSGSVHLVEPMGYLDFLGLQDGARLILTDSGGIQEETSVLGVQCLTLRPNTERPITITDGTNHLVGTNPEAIVEEAMKALERPRQPASIPLWDGHAGERIADVLVAGR